MLVVVWSSVKVSKVVLNDLHLYRKTLEHDLGVSITLNEALSMLLIKEREQDAS